MRYCTIEKCLTGHWGADLQNGQGYINFWEPSEISFKRNDKHLLFVDNKIRISKFYPLLRDFSDIKFSIKFSK